MKFQPVFPNTIATGQCRTAVANTSTDGSGTITTLFTAGANGAQLSLANVTSSSPIGTANSAMVISSYVSSDGGVTWKFNGAINFAAITPSAIAIGKALVLTGSEGAVILPLYLGPNQVLGVAQSIYVDSRDQLDWVIQKGYNF